MRMTKIIGPRLYSVLFNFWTVWRNRIPTMFLHIKFTIVNLEIAGVQYVNSEKKLENMFEFY